MMKLTFYSIQKMLCVKTGFKRLLQPILLFWTYISNTGQIRANKTLFTVGANSTNGFLICFAVESTAIFLCLILSCHAHSSNLIVNIQIATVGFTLAFCKIRFDI